MVSISFIAGCGIDYEKCEAMQAANARAQSELSTANRKALYDAVNLPVEKECGKNPYIIPLDFNDVNVYDKQAARIADWESCENNVKNKSSAVQINAEVKKNPDVITAQARVDKIAADYRRARCT